jgi:hypothetical protein
MTSGLSVVVQRLGARWCMFRAQPTVAIGGDSMHRLTQTSHHPRLGEEQHMAAVGLFRASTDITPKLWSIIGSVIAGVVIAGTGVYMTTSPQLPGPLREQHRPSAGSPDDDGFLVLLSAGAAYEQAYIATVEPLFFNAAIYNVTGHMPRPSTAVFLRLYDRAVARKLLYKAALSKAESFSKSLPRAKRPLIPAKEVDLEGLVHVVQDLQDDVPRDQFLRDVLNVTGSTQSHEPTRHEALLVTMRRKNG